MPIDFHSEAIAGTYASRIANADWADAMRQIVEPRGRTVADIGCGGGIYSRAWSDLGAERVIGIDFSAQMVADAMEASGDYPAIFFTQGDATATGLPDVSVDIVFERALIHHLPDLGSAFAEAWRILKPGGTLIVQDRTIEDVLRPASPEHFRGYFFEAFPSLLEVERQRRPGTGTVLDRMRATGFADASSTALDESRRTYATVQELQEDLRARTGRSILHALSDTELERLSGIITHHVAGRFPLTEIDSWTIWTGSKPA